MMKYSHFLKINNIFCFAVYHFMEGKASLPIYCCVGKFALLKRVASEIKIRNDTVGQGYLTLDKLIQNMFL